MTAILIAAVLSIDPSTYYSGNAQARIPATQYYNPIPQKIEEPKPPLVEEDDEQVPKPPEEKPADPLRVVVYVDLSDVPAVRKLLSECDRLPGLNVEYKDKSEVPDAGRRFKLPLAHYHTNAGWRFVEWSGPDAFRKRWIDGNPSQNAQQQARIVASRANGSARYRAKSYEWHLTQGESASALRSHLASPHAEHHGNAAPREFLAGLSFTELVGLHSDFHNGRPDWSQINRQAASSSRSQVATVMPLRSVFQFRRRSSSGCPGGNCPR